MMKKFVRRVLDAVVFGLLWAVFRLLEGVLYLARIRKLAR